MTKIKRHNTDGIARKADGIEVKTKLYNAYGKTKTKLHNLAIPCTLKKKNRKGPISKQIRREAALRLILRDSKISTTNEQRSLKTRK